MRQTRSSSWGMAMSWSGRVSEPEVCSWPLPGPTWHSAALLASCRAIPPSLQAQVGRYPDSGLTGHPQIHLPLQRHACFPCKPGWFRGTLFSKLTETKRKCLQLTPRCLRGICSGAALNCDVGCGGNTQEERVTACTHAGQRQTLGHERKAREVIAAGHQGYERLRGGEGLGQRSHLRGDSAPQRTLGNVR